MSIFLWMELKKLFTIQLLFRLKMERTRVTQTENYNRLIFIVQRTIELQSF